jgi:hypothetical protein
MAMARKSYDDSKKPSASGMKKVTNKILSDSKKKAKAKVEKNKSPKTNWITKI